MADPGGQLGDLGRILNLNSFYHYAHLKVQVLDTTISWLWTPREWGLLEYVVWGQGTGIG